VNGRGRTALAATLLCSSLLASCGGGGDGGSSSGVDCSLAAQQTWLHGYMHDQYYFNTLIQDPAVTSTFDSIDRYFGALLVSVDHWSYVQDSVSYTRFFGAGQTFGYGLAVAGQSTDPLPLRVRDVAPGSAADWAGLRRGMVVDSINGTDGATLKSTNQLSASLSATTAGEHITVQIRDSLNSPVSRQISLNATIYDLAPVGTPQIVTSVGGRKVAYLLYRTFIDSGMSALQSSLTQFANAGVQDLVLDLRYNGGGLVRIARDLASAIGGDRVYGQTFTTLKYNATHQASNARFAFTPGLSKLNLPRVYVLTGVRTCSASELVINGLKPFVQVIQIGATTCGKPYGFNPVEHCGNTFSALNFESVNALGAGGYTSGISPTCAASDDVEHALGDPAEALTAAALQHIDTGSCPATANASATSAQALRSARSSGRLIQDGEPLPGMMDR
jgi:C-terminal processing protease CtpA/Prc